MSEPVDLLLLDEPTNHLSPILAEQLEEALASYQGAPVVVAEGDLPGEPVPGLLHVQLGTP
ncbi:hypothetical protein AB0C18_32900 [Nonomuraea muscovyensis]